MIIQSLFSFNNISVTKHPQPHDASNTKTTFTSKICLVHNGSIRSSLFLFVASSPLSIKDRSHENCVDFVWSLQEYIIFNLTHIIYELELYSKCHFQGFVEHFHWSKKKKNHFLLTNTNKYTLVITILPYPHTYILRFPVHPEGRGTS